MYYTVHIDFQCIYTCVFLRYTRTEGCELLPREDDVDFFFMDFASRRFITLQIGTVKRDTMARIRVACSR